jgi:hypothetical protein
LQAKSGVIFGQFESTGIISFSLLAADAGGQLTVVEEYTFNVEEVPQFVLRTRDERSSNDDQFTDPTQDNLRYIVGQSYRIAPRVIDRSATTVSAGTVDDITYTLSKEAPSSFFVSASTGIIFGQFDRAVLDGQQTKTVTFTLIAVDTAGNSDVAESYTFQVVDKPKFIFQKEDVRTTEGDGFSDPTDVNIEYFVGDSYKFAPLSLDRDATTVSFGTVDGITYALSAGAPKSFFINSGSGILFGQFETAGQYTFSLLAVDEGLKTALVEEYNFKVSQRKQFTLARQDVRTEAGAEFTDPTFPFLFDFIVGVTYKIAPFAIDPGTTTVSAGAVDDITYTLSDGAPDSFFISSSTGVVFGTLDDERLYNFTLVAVDKGGKTAHLETFTLQARPPTDFKVFTVIRNGAAVRRCEGSTDIDASIGNCKQFTFTDPINTDVYYVGDRYTIAPLKLDASSTTVSSGEFSDITYRLSEGAPSSFFVQSLSGIISAEFKEDDQKQMQEFSLLAVDASGNVATVEAFAMTVESVEFKLINLADVNAIGRKPQVGSTLEYTDPTGSVAPLPNYAIGQLYQFAPIDLTADRYENANNKITYTATGAPQGFLIDPSDGYMQGTPTIAEVNKTFEVVIAAIDGRNTKIKLQTFQMHLKQRDADVAANGPGNKPCDNDGKEEDDIPFDQNFTCNCGSGFLGANCEVAAAASAVFQKGGNAAGIILGLLFVIAVIVAAIYRYRSHVISNRPMDFNTLFEEMVKSGEIDLKGGSTSSNNAGAIKRPREIKRKYLNLLEVVGVGQFGTGLLVW